MTTLAMAEPEARAANIALEPLLVVPGGVGSARGGHLPEPLRSMYGGDLSIPLRSDRPTVISNFVATLDGVVSYDTPEAAGGGEISGFFEPDRFVMGLLRALADVVLVGAGTVRAARHETWAADFPHRPSAGHIRDLRASLGLPPQPMTAVVSASGDLDLRQAAFQEPGLPVLILTTDDGARRLAEQKPPASVDVVGLGDDAPTAEALIGVLHDRGAKVVLCEGGPHLYGWLLRAGLVDELFMTIAPQVAGRSADAPRLSLIEDVAFQVDSAPWAQLIDLRRSGSHLFTRYSFEGRDR